MQRALRHMRTMVVLSSFPQTQTPACTGTSFKNRTHCADEVTHGFVALRKWTLQAREVGTPIISNYTRDALTGEHINVAPMAAETTTHLYAEESGSSLGMEVSETWVDVWLRLSASYLAHGLDLIQPCVVLVEVARLILRASSKYSVQFADADWWVRRRLKRVDRRCPADWDTKNWREKSLHC